MSETVSQPGAGDSAISVPQCHQAEGPQEVSVQAQCSGAGGVKAVTRSCRGDGREQVVVLSLRPLLQCHIAWAAHDEEVAPGVVGMSGTSTSGINVRVLGYKQFLFRHGRFGLPWWDG